MRVKYSDVLERMKKSANLKNDSRLARMLGVTPQALSNYKKRSKVPSDLLIKFADMQGLSVDWLLSGEGAKHRVGSGKDGGAASGVEEESSSYAAKSSFAVSSLINFAALNSDEFIYVGRLIKVLRSADKANAAVLKWTIDAFERAVAVDGAGAKIPLITEDASQPSTQSLPENLDEDPEDDPEF